MYDQLELFLVGAAVVLDTALLLIVLERINRPFVAVWLKLLVFGTLAFHLGHFGRAMISKIEPTEAIWLDHLFMCLLVSGLFLLPSGMLHAATRVFHTGLDAKPVRDLRYGTLYIPLILIPIACSAILRSRDRNLLSSLGWVTPTYIVWLLLANVAAIVLFVSFQRASQIPIAFLNRLIIALIAISLGGVLYATLSARHPLWEHCLRLPVSLSPLIPEALLIWYALKHRVLPLVMDRSMVYASALVLGLLLHQLIIGQIAEAARGRLGIDVSIVEAILLIVLFLLVPPIRTRFRESLRYLFSNNVFKVRDATRNLSVALSQKANLEPDALAQWFVNELADKLELSRALIVLESHLPGVTSCEKQTKAIRFESRKQFEAPKSEPQDTSSETDWTMISQCTQSQGRLERGMAIQRAVRLSDLQFDVAVALVAMERHGILLAFPLAFQSIHGAVLLGDRNRNDRLAAEQMISIALLCDQLAATLGNKRESIRRFQVERRMIQNEKLSTLGLIAGSLAHELRNPLSSIRTIASLTMEELGPEHVNRQDLSIIVSEIDKLSQTTTRLLDSARPADESSNSVTPDLVIAKLLVLLTPLARQLHVDLRHSLNCPNVEVAGSEAAMSEVFFNLLKNGIEAATGRTDAWVQIQSEKNHESSLEIVVSDNGPGIASELLDTLFEPFITGKSEGTGLGLFVVADRIREMNGSIKCSRCDDSSTQFRVSFPRSMPQ
ncbi:MAG: ATP-binding protein [Planctomycetota bacterium]|nr:ATP-binding protein [Planctomycetota bacterium]